MVLRILIAEHGPFYKIENNTLYSFIQRTIVKKKEKLTSETMFSKSLANARSISSWAELMQVACNLKKLKKQNLFIQISSWRNSIRSFFEMTKYLFTNYKIFL